MLASKPFEVAMKYVWLIVIPINLVIFAASYYSTQQFWAYQVCGKAFGLCEDQFMLGLAVVVGVGLFVAAGALD
jgi:hypothetical protein